MSPIRLLIADDREIFRQGLLTSLNEIEDIEIIALCSNYRATIDKTIELKPDVVLINPHIPGDDCARVIDIIKNKSPKSRILVLFPQPPRKRVQPAIALQAGVSGFVDADASVTQLVDSITQIYEGGTVLPSTLGSELYIETDNYRRRVVREYNLSLRELQVLDFLIMGLSNKQISQNMYITEATVKEHLTSIFKKLGVKTRLKAAVIAVEIKLSPDSLHINREEQSSMSGLDKGSFKSDLVVEESSLLKDM